MTGTGIHVDCRRGIPPSADVRIDRAVHAARAFAGRRVDEVLAAVPLLFTVCSTAQTAAAWHALAAAEGRPVARELIAAHGVLVRLEVAREHLWRMLIDWPRFTDRPAAPGALVAMRQLVASGSAGLFDETGPKDTASGAARQTGISAPFAPEPALAIHRDRLETVLGGFDDLLAEHVLGVSPEEWLSLRTLEDLERYASGARGAAAALLRLVSQRCWQTAAAAAPHYLPPLPNADLARRLDEPGADRFVEVPDWEGYACETSPLGRQRGSELMTAVLVGYGPGLYARAVAAVRELAGTSLAVRDLLEGWAPSPISAGGYAPGAAVAQVEAARGRLVHRVRVDAGSVVDYRIVAPTEWNFHPEGTLPRAVAALDGGDGGELTAQADLLITLLDPCVSYSLEVH